MNKLLIVRGEEWPGPSIRQIPYWEVASMWPKVGPMLNKVIERQDEWTLQGVYEKLTMPPIDISAMQLWYIEGYGALVTQINAYPTGIKKCLIFMAGGEKAKDCLNLLSTIENWAVDFYKLQRGKDKMIIWGRPGWQKLLKDYTVKTLSMEKIL